MYHTIKPIGKVFVPGKFEAYLQDKTLAYFTGSALYRETVSRCLKHQGAAVLEGDWNTIHALYRALDKQKKELVGTAVLKHKNIHYRNKCFRAVENSLLLRAAGSSIRITPPAEVPFLLNLCGEVEDGAKEKDYLIPVADYLKIVRDLEHRIPVAALDAALFCHYNVLPPRSRQTNDLAARVLRELAPAVKPAPCILDMGCGSGIIALLAAAIFPGARLTATDILVEALGTTRVNAALLEEAGMLIPGSVQVTRGGDLFEPLPAAQKFDIIIFNAPWVDTIAKSTAERAINDAGFATIKRFLAGCSSRLEKNGHVVLFYSNHAGDKTSALLEDLFREYGFPVYKLYKDKIQSRMKAKKWVTIYGYALAPGQERGE